MVLDAPKRLLYLRVAIAVGVIVAMALSHRLWISTRAYPLTPVFSLLKPIRWPFDYALFFAALFALAAVIFTSRLIPIFATLAVVLAVCDQSRLQPWFYEFFFLLLAVSFASPNACRLLIASTYIWSGIQKLNADFISNVFPSLLEPFLRHLPHGAHAIVHPLSMAAPFIELWIGIALLGRKFRLGGIVAACAMHIFILFAPGHPVDVPSNVAMAAAVVILFWKTKESVKQILWGEGPLHVGILLLFGIAPAFSLFGGWDHYLSAAMFAGNSNSGTIFFSDEMFDRLPDAIAEYVRVETPDIDSIDIAEWSEGELRVPPYPEIRIYKNVARKICTFSTGPNEVWLRITSKSTIGQKITGKSYTCGSL